MPKRIQRKRTAGWKMPAGAVYVGRSGIFGNPFTVAGFVEVWNPKAAPKEAADACVRFYRDWLREVMRGQWDHQEREKALRCAVPTLRGKDLACWCPEGAPCHAGVLIEFANRE